MTAPTEREVRRAVDRAGELQSAFGAPDATVENAIADWFLNLFDKAGLWQRWPCGDDECPARPAYDRRMSDLFEKEELAIAKAADDLIRDRLTDVAVRFAQEYPDAPRRSHDA